MAKACGWLASKQIFRKGDWSVKRPDLEPGGWSFEFENDWQPDVDDTAVVMMFLNRYREDPLLSTENSSGACAGYSACRGRMGAGEPSMPTIIRGSLTRYLLQTFGHVGPQHS